MTDSPQLYGSPVTQDELEAETATVMKTLAREMEKVRDQLYHLNKMHTVSIMAAILYGKTSSSSADEAKELYDRVQNQITRRET